ncbi:MAG TPA: hypothetical protein VIN10_13055 [Bacteroidales bacterium]
MSAQGKVRTTGYKRKISFRKITDSIHVPEAQLRAALRSKSLREEQIEFLCELLSIESDRKQKSKNNSDYDDLFMQGKMFC